MNADKKTAGQIARENFFGDDKYAWTDLIEQEQARWEAAAAAVIAHHEASKKPAPKFKVGDRIRRIKDFATWAPEGFETVVIPDNCYIDKLGFTPLIDPAQWEKVEWTLPAPPPGQLWHRADWAEDMLPNGWRPLLMTELDNAIYSDIERLNPAIYDCFAGGWQAEWRADSKEALTCFYRTRRPLPPSHAVTFTLPPLTLQTGKLSLASQ